MSQRRQSDISDSAGRIILKEEHAPRRGGPGACSDTYMLTYCLRHWFTRYDIASGLHIVLRYKLTEVAEPSQPGDKVITFHSGG